MYAGRVVEYGSVHDIFNNPLHPYTQGLFKSMPRLGEEKHRLDVIPGNVPNPANFPSGCPFHPRCSATMEQAKQAKVEDTIEVNVEGDHDTHHVMQTCVHHDPPLLEVSSKHWVACHFAQGYSSGKETVPDVAYRKEGVGVVKSAVQSGSSDTAPP